MLLESIYGIRIRVDRQDAGTLRLSFRYHPKLVEWVKGLRGKSWNAESKTWSISDVTRNHIQLLRITGDDPFRPKPKVQIPLDDRHRPLHAYQWEGVEAALAERTIELAMEPGLGKTITAIEVIERSNLRSWIWISTLTAIYATRMELKKWNCKLPVTYSPGTEGIYLCHYDRLQKIIAQWPQGRPAPDGLIVDESQKCKGYDTIRTRCVQHIADSMRKEHKNPFILNMSGYPDPKNPLDWWSQIEIIEPGLIPEGSPTQLSKRLAFIRREDNGLRIFDKILGWKHDPEICNVCGIHKQNHSPVALLSKGITGHDHQPSEDKVREFAREISHKVFVRKKVDCLDLPPRIYRTISLIPSRDLLLAAKVLATTVAGGGVRMVKLRELSDGFQYNDDVIKFPCKSCARGQTPAEWSDEPRLPESDPSESVVDDGQLLPCYECHGQGYTVKETRESKRIHTQKTDALAEVIEEKEDLGESRLITFAGFKESVDAAVREYNKRSWTVFRIDGRGCYLCRPDQTPLAYDRETALTRFQDLSDRTNIAWVGHPLSGGVGIQLTASKTIAFVSNDYGPDTREQAISRIERIGSRGVEIIDIDVLPVDKLVRIKLQEKKNISDITAAEITACLDASLEENVTNDS